ncbi:ectoine hydroxylase [Kamptonema sp. UHCC 0994]|uniref:ectoine hydroxylase n=1 Tax=Kamptonema sp. UHCC 0994 TaxID=3031329 RepID=UPI0023B8AD0D|nr:ectoine hydroxylase [Kamptonema sp. UHCC 0994]MDF0551650.1 ectoine hydroxylase [Kamptonema sp. UHCC 0994]
MPLTKQIYTSRMIAETSIQERQEPIIYSENTPPVALDQNQIDFYQDKGFLFIENFFSPDEVKQFNLETKRLLDSKEITDSDYTFTEVGTDIVRSIFSMQNFSQIFDYLSRDQRILDIVHYLLGDRVYIHQSRINFKPGFSGSGFYWHSDFETWHIEDGMPNMRALSAMISLTENTEYNGPLMVIPGSHKQFVGCAGETPKDHYKESLKEQRYGLPDEASLTQLVEAGGLVTIKSSPGSIVFFDCNLIHGSNNNISPHSRVNIFFVYNSVQNTLQETVGGLKPRPEFVAARKNIAPLEPISPNHQ